MCVAAFMPGFFELLIVCSMAVLGVVPFWMICSKAGFPGWISLLILVPMLNIVLLFYIAFADWPALKAQTDRGSAE